MCSDPLHEHPVFVHAGVLVARETTIPAPLAFTPDENWDGIDGSWSSFTLRVGTPSQTVRVFPSWMSYQTWVIATQGCESSSDVSACASARGGLFNYSQSSTFGEIGIYSTWIEQNLGYIGNAEYGWDVVSLGGLGDGGPTLKNTTVGAVAVDAFYLGVFGLNPKPTNWTSFEDSSPSYMTQLKDQKLIPSVSFGYTAGAPYRFTGVLASLTLGGYDSALFSPSPVEFGFAANNERDTVVAIQSITTTQQNSSTEVELLPTPIYALVDTTVPQIWLPIEACQKFESEFGLEYDNTTDLYLVNATLHAALLERDANVTFTLAQGTSGGTTTTIILPYSAFDLTALPPYQGLSNSSTYFPLRRAQNSTQYTLGRTFMQEAYVTVDYERAKFNVSQCTWVQNPSQTLVPIYPAAASENSQYSGAGPSAAGSPSSSSSSLSGGAIGGIVAGVMAGIIALAAVSAWYFRRRYQARAAEAERKDGTPTTLVEASSDGGHGTHISTSTQATQVVSPLGPGGCSEAGGAQLFEMLGDMPDISQADGRQITEKDMMQRREQMYNGTPPLASQETLETPQAQRQEPRRMVQPGEVLIRDEVREYHSHDRFSFEGGSTFDSN
ncbi:aspartic peptidase domain-containing protein [Delphinella strobiligena]|nr:aspartic peptidase domain-containing protein [Delphinella strobiligena]